MDETLFNKAAFDKVWFGETRFIETEISETEIGETGFAETKSVKREFVSETGFGETEIDDTRINRRNFNWQHRQQATSLILKRRKGYLRNGNQRDVCCGSVACSTYLLLRFLWRQIFWISDWLIWFPQAAK